MPRTVETVRGILVYHVTQAPRQPESRAERGHLNTHNDDRRHLHLGLWPRPSRAAPILRVQMAPPTGEGENRSLLPACAQFAERDETCSGAVFSAEPHNGDERPYSQ